MELEHKCGNCSGGCGSSEDSATSSSCNNKNSKTMTIVENGMEVLCNVLKVFDTEESKYIALQDKDSERIYLYIYLEDDDNVILNKIESIEELRLVGSLLIEFLEEE